MLVASLNPMLCLRSEKLRHHGIRLHMFNVIFLDFLVVERVLIVVIHVQHDIGARCLRYQIVRVLYPMLHSLMTLLVNRPWSTNK